jgi:hypothetical protein
MLLREFHKVGVLLQPKQLKRELKPLSILLHGEVENSQVARKVDRRTVGKALTLTRVLRPPRPYTLRLLRKHKILAHLQCRTAALLKVVHKRLSALDF